MDHTELVKGFSNELFTAINEKLIDSKLTVATRSDVKPASSERILEIHNVGSYEELDLQVLSVRHASSTDARISISRDLFRIMKDYGFRNALIATYSDDQNFWRYSLITSDLDISDKGKITKQFSNPKRYSFLLGENQKVNTPNKQLLKLGSVTTLDDLKKRFSLEVVNNEFYNSIAALFDALVGSEGAILNQSQLQIVERLTEVTYVKTEKSSKCYKIIPLLKYPSSGDSFQFAVRLIGRIIFCWFLKEKHSSNGIPLISNEILSAAALNKNDSYYHNILAPLFFEALNKPIENRHDNYRANDFELVPYLNGGLFTPDPKDHYKFDKVSGFSEPELVDIPKPWLSEFFTLLELFNFTVDENTSFDVELSIDPEMLGRVFEGLLARINPETGETARKSTGSYYTPREIVDYMVDESLAQYLLTNSNINEGKIRALVSYDLTDDEMYPLDEGEKKTILELIGNVKILDPACGSGAFPIGILQKMVFMLEQIDPNSQWWLERQLVGASPELKKYLEKEYKSKNYAFLRKLGVLRESIFGVDIQSIATEISRLRCFLTLIVDQSVEDNMSNRGIEPLPNLDFKFVTANSLIGIKSEKNKKVVQTEMFEDSSGIENLKDIRNEYFNSHGNERETLKLKFSEAQNSMLQNMIKHHHYGFGDITQKLSSWRPFSSDKNDWFDPEWMFGIDSFDLVIGNPPYIQLQKLKHESTYALYKEEGYKSFKKTGDIYSLFYERGLEIAKKGTGLLCYITSNKWMRAGYGDVLREYFSQKNPIKLLNFGGLQIFESATVDTNILLIENATNANSLLAVQFQNDFKNGDNIAQYVSSNLMKLSDLSSVAWCIASTEEIELKKKIEALSSPLEEWDVNINYGIRTGYNEAFIIDEATKDQLIKSDPRSTELIRPILRGKDISKYKFSWDKKYLIAVHYDMSKEIDNFPAIKEHLIRYKDPLQDRAQVKRGDHHWMELDQNPSKAYMGKIGGAKIIYPNMSNAFSAVYDDNNFVVNQKCFFITGNNLKYLLAFLNSKLNFFNFKFIGASLGEGGYEMSKIFINKLPIKSISLDKQKPFENLVDNIMTNINSDDYQSNTRKQEDTNNSLAQIDQLIYGLYNLTTNEINIINNSTK
jgi:adenine-specific DNA-methyltransferase